jgi:hypothetical protein
VSTLIGRLGTSGHLNGSFTDARLHCPVSVLASKDGSTLYVGQWSTRTSAYRCKILRRCNLQTGMVQDAYDATTRTNDLDISEDDSIYFPGCVSDMCMYI